MKFQSNKIRYFLRLINGFRCPVCGRYSDIAKYKNKCPLCESCYALWESECREVENETHKRSAINKQAGAVHSLAYLAYYRPYLDTTAKKLVLDLKKIDSYDIYSFLTDNLVYKLQSYYNNDIPGDAVIINVPRSRKAVSKYGFDQAALLAKNTASKLNIKYINAIGYKPGRRFTQQKKLTQIERTKNAADAYFIKTKKIASFFGKRCILIDDIYTTGATLAACAELLVNHGAKYIDCAVVAKTI